MTNDVIEAVKAPALVTAVVEYSETAAAIATLRERYRGALYEVRTAAGMDEARKARAELRGLRVALEKRREDVKAPLLERGRLLDAEAKRITAALVELEDPIDDQIKGEEARKEIEKALAAAAEKKRVDGIRAKIDVLRGMVLAAARMTAAEIAEVVATLQARTFTVEEFAESMEDAQRATAAALAQLGELYDARSAQEAEATRLKAEREDLDRRKAEQDARDAEAKAERQAAEVALQVQRDEIAAEEKRQGAERARLREEERKRQEAEERRALEEKAKKATAEAEERDRVRADEARQARAAERRERVKAARAPSTCDALYAIADIVRFKSIPDDEAREAVDIVCEANLPELKGMHGSGPPAP